MNSVEYLSANQDYQREEWESVSEKKKPAFGIKHLFIFILITVVVILVMIPSVIKNGRKMDLSNAISHGRCVYSVMMDFEADYGSLPDDATAASSAELQGFHGPFSNDYLSQLIAGGYLRSEEVFFAKDHRYESIKADNVIMPSSRILEKNECGLSYVLVDDKEKRRGLRRSDRGDLPVLVAPLVNEWGSFEEVSYNGLGAIIRLDGSSSAEHLRPSDQKIKMRDGGTLFDSGLGMFWDALKPVVLLPER